MILDKLTRKLALNIYNNSTKYKEEDDIEVIKYGLDVFINTVSVIVFSLIVAYLLGTIKATILAMIAFALLRMFSGGYHFKSSELCILISITVMVISPAISELYYISNNINYISILIILLYAPSSEKIKDKNKKHYIFKLVSLLLVLINLFIIKNEIITVQLFIQSLTILLNKKKVPYE